MIIPVGLVFGVVYYFGFRFAISKWNLKTPGRDETEENKESKTETVDERTKAIIEALGGRKNIENVEACITRLRLELETTDKINEQQLKVLGASGVMKMKSNSVQIVFGPESGKLKDKIKKVL